MIAFLLPTNDPVSMFKHLLPSLHNVQYASGKIVFCINFQMPYTEEEISTVVNEFAKLNIPMQYKYSEYEIERKGLIPFNRMRYDCATLCTTADLYALCDDDFVFEKESDIMIEDIIHRFNKNAQLGVVQCEKKSSFIPFCYSLRQPRMHNFFTANGYFFRNINNVNSDVLVYPSTALDCLGAGEEYVIGLELAKHGYGIEVRTRSTIEHVRNVDKYNRSPYEWGSQEIVNNHRGCHYYINEKYKEVI